MKEVINNKKVIKRKSVNNKYHNSSKRIRSKRNRKNVIKRLSVMFGIPTLLILGSLFLTFSYADINDDHTEIVDTATKLSEAGMSAEVSKKVLKSIYKGYYIESNGNELVIAVYTVNDNVKAIAHIQYENIE
ncbi:MAG: hypothetical protein E7E64_05205 [Clostridium celatum]|uniref:hypothetical protein n=1 Tax=Clostridium tertium TaxID=1559 RepID=UPI0028FF8F83|nr:hypothetical protein [Clostridium celatum]